MSILLTVFLLGQAFFIYMLWRNHATRDMLIDVIDQVTIAATVDSNQGRDWHWRHHAYEKVKYEQILWKWWAPLEPKYYWPDLAFLDHTQAKEVQA